MYNRPSFFGTGSNSIWNQQSQQFSSPFGASTTANPSPFANLGASTNTSQPSLFASLGQNQQQSGSSVFGTSQPQQSTGLFGSSQPQQSTGLFGSSHAPQSSGLFGSSQPQQAGGMFGSTSQPQQQTNPFGASLLGGQQQGNSLLGTSTRQPALHPLGSLPGGNRQQQQTQLGQTLGQSQVLGSSAWQDGRQSLGVQKSEAEKIMRVKQQWDAQDQVSPLRSYLYNKVGREQAIYYQPGPQDDKEKWEEASWKRPDPDYVPVLVKGFWELGKRAQRQVDFMNLMQGRLHEINNALTELLARHDLKISVRTAECRRRHLELSQRCLQLAGKAQVLRNRGFALDSAEDILKKQLMQLERAVMNPNLQSRQDEIYARMISIRENSKRLMVDIERTANTSTNGEDKVKDEAMMAQAKIILDGYDQQLRHMQQELKTVQEEFKEWEESQKPTTNGTSTTTGTSR